ncbi:CheR family methyltransferase [Gloeocapsopsis dulcis]|uniref:protein-glutamate O-methyltransferase n=1 Tax=Gloeocapsopsis dulcis AAB1 = 1H9 TaxID=1433147 RepID=A0A6N8FPD3_9CHRO|nr:CheR family methyltransferase [Gloeocapsopsis dulcis]MUL35170.1 chemotaxis protein CheR [Gloeocapsopsis dulcis AAB1 = 1H9]WNN89051.1 CheR family methyltransferase [Gloeocapsopsis dulcis]
MPSPETSPEFEALLDYLKHYQGCDLTGYKRSSLMRRFEHRMRSIKIDSYQCYLQYLQQHSEEYLALLNDVLINFTSFFRDPDAWSYLANEIIPKIIAQKQPNEPIRVWSAGCAAGQEIYSLLLLLAEILGIEACLERVQCYATDADAVAIQQARKGIYSELEISGISPNLLKKYFEQTQQGYVFHSKLRRTIIFSQHNLEKNAPISKIDLLICRNVLIYFNPETQVSILVRFHFALKNTGFLFLGKSEVLVNRREIFTPVDLKHRIYTKGLHLSVEDHLSINPKSFRKPLTDRPLPIQNYFWQAAFESSPNAQFAVDLNGYLIAANEQANLLFGLTLNDWNRPFQDLEPGKLVAAHTSAKITANRRVLLKNIEWNTSQGTQCFDVAIVPVFNHRKQLIGSTLTFVVQGVTVSLEAWQNAGSRR